MPRQKVADIDYKMLGDRINQYSTGEARTQSHKFLRTHNKDVRLCLEWERENRKPRSIKLPPTRWPGAEFIPYPLYRAICSVAFLPAPQRIRPKKDGVELTNKQKEILKDFTPKSREALELRFKGFSASQIATKLGITRDAVYKRLNSAKKS